MNADQAPDWRQLAATVQESLAEPLSDWFMDEGALSVSLDDAGDQPLFEPPPGATPLWRLTRVTALFPGDIDVAPIAAAARDRFGGQILAWDDMVLQDQPWERAWMEHFQPMRFGRRLWICPTGFEPPEPDAVNVILDPGLAFGTGTHPTTALCLDWLESLDLAGWTVLDYGCGSGILAVAALRLGAAAAHGIDIDPQALTASAENARKNAVEPGLTLGYPSDPPPPPADVVVANILSGPLVELAADILARLKPGGRLALSGLLAVQADTVRAAYADAVAFDPMGQREDWAILTGVKRLSAQVD
ncbi:MAG: 50S ribosomal protein L11 methyltransferase [Methylococcus sp.]